MTRDKKALRSPRTPPPRTGAGARQPLITPASSSNDESRTPTTVSDNTRSSSSGTEASEPPSPWSQSEAERRASEAAGDDRGWDDYTGVRDGDFQTSPTPVRYNAREIRFPSLGGVLGGVDLSARAKPPRPGDRSPARDYTPRPPKKDTPAEEDSSRAGNDKPDIVSTPESQEEELSAAADRGTPGAQCNDPGAPFTPEPATEERNVSTLEAPTGEPNNGPSTVKYPPRMKLEIGTQNPAWKPPPDPYEGLTPRAARTLALADWDRAAAAMSSPPISESSGEESALEPPVAGLTPDEIRDVMLEKRDMEARKAGVDAEKLLLQQECARMLSIAKGYNPGDLDASEAAALGRKAPSSSSRPKAEVLENLKRRVGDGIRVADGEAARHQRRVLDVEADSGMDLEERAEKLRDEYAAIHGHVTRRRKLGLWEETLDRLIAGATLEETVSRWEAKRDESNDLERRIYKAERKVRKWGKANKGKKLPKIGPPPATAKAPKPKKTGSSPAHLKNELSKLTPLPAGGVTPAWLGKNFPFPKSWAEWEHQHELLSAHTAAYTKQQKAPLRKEVARLKSDNAKLSAFDEVKTAQEALDAERRALEEERTQLRAKEAKIAAFQAQVRADVKAIDGVTKEHAKFIAVIRDNLSRSIKTLTESQTREVLQADLIYKRVQENIGEACAHVQLARNTIEEFCGDPDDDRAHATPWGLVLKVERRDRTIDDLEREIAAFGEGLSVLVEEMAKLQDKADASAELKVLSSDVAGILSVAQELLQGAEDARAQNASPEDEDPKDMARSDAFGNVTKMLKRCNGWTATFEGRLREYRDLCGEYKAARDEADKKAKEFRLAIASLRGENAALQGAATAEKEAALAEREAAHSRVVQALERKLAHAAVQLRKCDEDFQRISQECEKLQAKVREQEEMLLAFPTQSSGATKGDASIQPKDAARKLEEEIQKRAQWKQTSRKEGTANQRGTIQALVRKNRVLTRDLEDMTEKYENRLDAAAEAAKALAELHETQVALKRSQYEHQKAQREMEEIREEKRDLEHYKLDSRDVDFGLKYGSEKASAELEMEKIEWQTRERELTATIEDKEHEITKLNVQLDDTKRCCEVALEGQRDLAASITFSQEFPEEKVRLLKECISARASLEGDLQRLGQECASLGADHQRATEKARGLKRDVAKFKNEAEKRRAELAHTIRDHTSLQMKYDKLTVEARQLRRLVDDQQHKAKDSGEKWDDMPAEPTKEMLMTRVGRLRDNLKLALDSVGSEYLDPNEDEPTIRDSKRLFRLSYDVLSWIPSKKEPTRPVFTRGDMHNVWMLQAIQNMRMDICRVMSYHDYSTAAKALAKLEEHVQDLDLNVFTNEVWGSIEVLRTWIAFHSGRNRCGAEAALQRALSLKPETWAPEYQEMLRVLEGQLEAEARRQEDGGESGGAERCRCRFKRFPCDLHRDDDCGCKFQTVIDPCDGHSTVFESHGKISGELDKLKLSQSDDLVSGSGPSTPIQGASESDY